MAIVAVFQAPGLTQEIYEQAVSRLTGGRRTSMQAASDWPVPGLLAHIAGQSGAGFRVIDVWESEEAFSRFGEHLRPVLQEVGVEGAPDIYPAYAFVVG